MITSTEKIFHTLRDLGHPMESTSRILDFGCGNGDTVKALRDQHWDVYGCDLKFKEGSHVLDLIRENSIRLIPEEQYRLPFEDEFFDCVYSAEVFEHVRNYPETLAEIHRVLKPGGVSLHLFPSRYRFLECHVGIPLASLFQNYGWLWFWAVLGIRKESQKGLPAKATARMNLDYLTTSTNYCSKRTLAAFVKGAFPEFQFCEMAAARYSEKLQPIYAMLAKLPFAAQALSAFQTRALFLRKQGRSN